MQPIGTRNEVTMYISTVYKTGLQLRWLLTEGKHRWKVSTVGFEFADSPLTIGRAAEGVR